MATLPSLAAAQDPRSVLLEAYALLLAEAPTPEEYSMAESESRRAASALSPRFSLRQSGAWSFGAAPSVSVAANLSVPLHDPFAEAQVQLARWRLGLAEHNRRADERARLLEFERTLLVAGHLEAVEELLEEHLTLLRRTRATVDRQWPASGLPAAEEVALLELELALERTRGELALLRDHIASRLQLHPSELPSLRQARPREAARYARSGAWPATRIPEGGADESLARCLEANDEAVRSRLVLAAARFEEAEPAKSSGRLAIEAAADARYDPNDMNAPMAAGLRLSLSAELPPGGPLNGSATIGGSASELMQTITLTWPAGVGATREAAGGRAEAAHAERLEEVRLELLRAFRVRHEAAAGLRMRGAALDLIATERADASAASRNELPQAILAYRNAELELALAELELAHACGESR